VIRGNQGEWLGGFARCVGLCSAFMAELWGVVEGLRYTLICVIAAILLKPIFCFVYSPQHFLLISKIFLFFFYNSKIFLFRSYKIGPKNIYNPYIIIFKKKIKKYLCNLQKIIFKFVYLKMLKLYL
jgi:hypothetical protein